MFLIKPCINVTRVVNTGTSEICYEVSALLFDLQTALSLINLPLQPLLKAIWVALNSSWIFQRDIMIFKMLLVYNFLHIYVYVYTKLKIHVATNVYCFVMFLMYE